MGSATELARAVRPRFVSDRARRMLDSLRKGAEPEGGDDEPSIFDELDVLYDGAKRTGDPRWFPKGGEAELTRLARERKRDPGA